MEQKTTDALALHILPGDTPVAQLEVKNAVASLTTKEKFFTHWLSVACWQGSKICLHQLSEESPVIWDLLLTVFQGQTAPSIEKKRDELVKQGKVSAEEVNGFLEYCAVFFNNMGNYLSFGDTKFVPRVPKDKFGFLAEAFGTKQKDNVKKLFEAAAAKIYSLNANELMLGFPDQGGVSTYYSSNITKAEIDLVGEFMVSKHISPYNTRLFKESPGVFRLVLAAAIDPPKLIATEKFKDVTVKIVKGDYGTILKDVADALTMAQKYVSNDIEKEMLQHYVKHFLGGDIDDHKASQKAWIKNVGPVVETNIGFIESYRDPAGVRGEFEGFVAVVNKETSRKFGELVNKAGPFLQKLPWGASFEKDKFSKPDFTSLEVVSFASSGIPAGINIPNYDDIRQNLGFKNVSLGNVISAKGAADERITFLKDEDQKVFTEMKTPSFEVQVGCHELLGHGSGKLLSQLPDGGFNFDTSVVNPLTKQKVATWWKPGETYDVAFGTISSSYEECRAEAVGIFLSTDRDLLKIFGHASEQEQDDIMYVNWLNMVRAGLVGLEFYSPPTEQQKSGQWRQAHMQARYAILRVLLKASGGLVNLTIGKDDAQISIDRSKIRSVGVPAIAQFLMQLQVYKSTCDVGAARKLYDELTTVPEEWLQLRNIVIAKKKARRIFVQIHSQLTADGSGVEFTEFPATYAGVIGSCITRFTK